MELQTLKKKTTLLETFFTEEVGAYYNINLTQNFVPGYMFQVINGKKYQVNEKIGLPENARFTDVIAYWKKMVREAEQPAYSDFLNIPHLMQQFHNRIEHVSHRYWTKNTLLEPMYAEQHIVMYQDEETGDILGFSYILDRTEHYYAEQYRQRLEKDNKNLNALLHVEKQYTQVLSALSKIYCQIFSVNIPGDLHTELYHGNSALSPREKTKGAQAAFNRMTEIAVDSAYREGMKAFVDFTTLPARLENTDYVNHTFLSTDRKWVLATFIVQNRDSLSVVTDVLFTLTDITKTQKEEEKQKQLLRDAAQMADSANKAKSQFMLSMSHDIRTPLNGIIGLLEINGEHLDNYALLKENHPRLVAACDHLLSLVNDILQFSKLEEGSVQFEKESVDLKRLSNEVGTLVNMEAQKYNISLEFPQQDLPYPHVLSSPLHLKQIFMNIYSNCIRYNRKNGKITTEVRFLGCDRNIVTYQWCISDTGIGMSKEFLSHIFEPFAQENTKVISNRSGTGLGMSIVKRLLEGMNGSIQISSTSGKGSTFLLTIPFEITDLVPVSDAHPSQITGSLTGIHLLLVEDNDLNCEIAEFRLKEAGAIVTSASDGKEALDLFLKEPPHTFDAIVMDILMPVLNGLDATRAIRSSEKEDAETIPIIALTANAFHENIAECYEAGMNAHIAKPFHIQNAIDVLKRLVPVH